MEALAAALQPGAKLAGLVVLERQQGAKQVGAMARISCDCGASSRGDYQPAAG